MIWLGHAANRGAERLPIVRTVVATWRDSLSVLDSVVILFAAVVTVLFGLNYFSLGKWTSDARPHLLLLLNLGQFVGQPLVLSLLAISVHRSLLLGKGDTGLIRHYRRYFRFFGYVVAVLVLCQVPLVVIELGFTGAGGPIIPVIFLGIILLLAALGIIVRSLVMFPALAVDAPGARWSNALKDTKGHGLRMFMILMCTVMPLLLAAIVLSLLMEPVVAMPLSEFVALEIQSVGAAITTIVVAALASRLYTCYADRLGRPADLK